MQEVIDVRRCGDEEIRCRATPLEHLGLKLPVHGSTLRPHDLQGAWNRLSYKMSYTVAMADTITFRPDEDTSKALEVLTRDGTAVSAAVRSALIDAARRKASAAIRAEAEKLAEDETDRAEAMQVLRDMETLRAW